MQTSVVMQTAVVMQTVVVKQTQVVELTKLVMVTPTARPNPEAVIPNVEPNATVTVWTFWLSPTFDDYIKDTRSPASRQRILASP